MLSMIVIVLKLDSIEVSLLILYSAFSLFIARFYWYNLSRNY